MLSDFHRLTYCQDEYIDGAGHVSDIIGHFLTDNYVPTFLTKFDRLYWYANT